MRQAEVFESKYLKADFLRIPGSDEFSTRIVTLTGEIEWSQPFADGRRQRLVSFKELDKKLGLNNINWKSIAKIAKQEDDEHWAGVKIELWVDENVQYGGDIVDGIRIRKPPFAATLPAEAKTLPPIETVPLPRPAESGPAPISTKKMAFQSWVNQAQPNKPDAAEFKNAVSVIITRSKKPEDQFGAAEWTEVANSYIPF